MEPVEQYTEQPASESLDETYRRLSLLPGGVAAPRQDVYRTRLAAWAEGLHEKVREVIYATRAQWVRARNRFGARYQDHAPTLAKFVCSQSVLAWFEGVSAEESAHYDGVPPQVLVEAWRIFDERAKQCHPRDFVPAKSTTAVRASSPAPEKKREPRPKTTFQMMAQLDREDAQIARETEEKERHAFEAKELSRVYEALEEAMSAGVDIDKRRQEYRRAYQIAASRRPEREYLQNFPNPL
jgi:hypothetical protein